MTDSEVVAGRLLEYRDEPPERVCAEMPDGKGIMGRFYTMGDILGIIMYPKREFTTYELITRLVELMGGPAQRRAAESELSESGDAVRKDGGE